MKSAVHFPVTAVLKMMAKLNKLFSCTVKTAGFSHSFLLTVYSKLMISCVLLNGFYLSRACVRGEREGNYKIFFSEACYAAAIATHSVFCQID